MFTSTSVVNVESFLTQTTVNSNLTNWVLALPTTLIQSYSYLPCGSLGGPLNVSKNEFQIDRSPKFRAVGVKTQKFTFPLTRHIICFFLWKWYVSLEINNVARCYLQWIANACWFRIIIVVIIIVWLAPFQCVALLAANNLQSDLSSASMVAFSTLRLWYDRSFFIVASQKVWGLPAGLFQSLTNCQKNSDLGQPVNICQCQGQGHGRLNMPLQILGIVAEWFTVHVICW